MANPWGGIMAGAGQGIMALNDWMTSEDIEDALKDSLNNLDFHQGKIDARLMDQIANLRSSTPEAERQKAMSEFMSQLASVRGSLPGAAGAPAGGARAQEMAATNAGGLQAFGKKEAGIEASIAAPMRQRLNEGLSMNKTGSDIRLLGREMEKQQFLDQLRIKRKSQKNPWLDMLGEGLKAAGGAMAGGMGGTSSLGNTGAGSGYSASAQRSGGGNYVYGGARG